MTVENTKYKRRKVNTDVCEDIEGEGVTKFIYTYEKDTS